MIKSNYSRIGYTPRGDGTFFVYELDWNEVHKFLATRCELSTNKTVKRGPFRVRIVNDASK